MTGTCVNSSNATSQNSKFAAAQGADESAIAANNAKRLEHMSD